MTYNVLYGSISVGKANENFYIEEDTIIFKHLINASFVSYLYTYFGGESEYNIFVPLVCKGRYGKTANDLYRDKLYKNIRYFFLDSNIHSAMNGESLSSELTWLKKNNLCIDIILNNQPSQSLELCKLFQYNNYNIPVLSIHHSCVLENGEGFEEWSKLTSSFQDEVFWLSNFMYGNFILLSNQQKKGIKKRLSKYLKPSALMSFDKRSTVVTTGSNVKPIGLEKKYLVGSFYRVDSWKRSEEVLMFINKLSISDSKGNEYIGTATSSINFNDKLAFKFVENCSREEFLRYAEQTKFAIWNSKGEGSPIAPLEASILGCLPILRREAWSEDFLRGLNWKLYFDRLEEIPSLIKYGRENYDVLKDELLSFIDSKFGLDKCRELMFNLIKTLTAKNQVDKKKIKGGNFFQSVRDLDVVNFSKLSFPNQMGNEFYSRGEIKRILMNELGLSETFNNMVVVLRKR